jgi:hypothetical protein
VHVGTAAVCVTLKQHNNGDQRLPSPGITSPHIFLSVGICNARVVSLYAVPSRHR